MLTVGRASRFRFVRPTILALALALVIAMGAAAAVRRDRAESSRQPTPSVRKHQPRYETVESVCANHLRFRCLWTPGGRVVVLARADQDAKQSPTILLDLGGPGADVVSVLGLLPAWTRNVNLVVVPEAWTLGCASVEPRSCGEDAQQSDRELTAAVEEASHAWGGIDGVIGFSYGAVRLLPVIEQPEFSAVPVTLIAPAPPPDVRGDAWADARLANAVRTLRRQLPSGPGLVPLLAGRRDVSRSTAQLAIVGLTTDLRDNRAFLGDLLRDERPLTSGQHQAVEAAARSLTLAGQTSAPARTAYFSEICSRYRGWDEARTAFGRWHRRHCASTSASRASLSLPSEGKRSGRVELWINSDDPVTDRALQLRWADWWPQADVHLFASVGHDLPPAGSMSAFLDRVRATRR